MRIRLVATDLDGTLLGSDGQLSRRTADALVAADEAGLTVVFVTGRPIRWTEELFDHVGSHGLAILSNGAVVYDVAARGVRTVRAIEPTVGLRIAARIREAVPDSAFAVEQVSGISFEPAFLDDHRVPPDSRCGPLASILDGPVVKLLARHEHLPAHEFWPAAATAVGDEAIVTWSSEDDALLEISAPGVTKAATLALLCEELGIEAAEVLAIGDMPNDLAMLEWVGTSYAMANAHASVLAAADHVASSNDDDGVAVVLERLITEGRLGGRVAG